jgi:membrane-associated PAP2 superfamily phosphatase
MNRLAHDRREKPVEADRRRAAPPLAADQPTPTGHDVLTFLSPDEAHAAMTARFVALRRTSIRCSLLPLALLLSASALIHLTDADRKISEMCYNRETGFFIGFMAEFPRDVSHWGRFPAMVVGIGAFLLSSLGWSITRFRPWRFSGIYLALVLVVGPGLMVNWVLKPYFGRPRPSQLVDFGGELAYVTLGNIHPADGGFSFPSGHAAMGFYLFAPAFLTYRRRWPRWTWIAAGLLCGGLVGWSRVVIGSHFFGDVLWSAGVVYFTCLAFSPMLLFDSAAAAVPAATLPMPASDGETDVAAPRRRRQAA